MMQVGGERVSHFDADTLHRIYRIALILQLLLTPLLAIYKNKKVTI